MTVRAEPKYAMPDGSYPINTCADVTKAANLAHHSKTYSFAEVKAHVMKAKAGLGCPDSVLPDTWDESNAAATDGATRAESGMSSSFAANTPWDPDNDGDDDSTPEGDTDHSHWDEDGQPIAAAWLADGQTPPEVPGEDEVDGESNGVPGPTNVGPHQSAGYSGLNSNAPMDNLVRAIGSGFELRDTSAGPTEFFGTFSRFNQWYQVDSVWEGQFMERVLPGAFADTIAKDKANMRVLYDHGMDPAIGNKPLGPIRTLREDQEGPYFDGPFLDTDYNRDFVIPALTGRLMDGSHVGSQLGSSFRFQVEEDKWNMRPNPDRNNPNGIPERSIVKAKVFEFGPVTFPANPGASASARSLSDEWIAHLIGDTRFQAQFAERVGTKVAEMVLRSVPAETQQEIMHRSTAARQRQDALRRKARALLVIAG